MKLYPFGRFTLSLPDNHKLSEIHHTHVLYDRLLFQLLAPMLAGQAGGTVVDIGANVGDSAASFRSVCSNPLLCVEGAEDFLPHLFHNVRRIDGGDIEVVDRFVMPARLAGRRFSYRSEPGTGHLAPEVRDAPVVDGSRYVSVADVVARAVALGKGVAPALVKVDTDGLDAPIVDELIDLVGCPLVFECDTVHLVLDGGNPWQALFQRFDELGFSAVVFDNMGLPMACADSGLGRLLADLSGWVHLQHGVLPVRVHYLDVLAFPSRCRPNYEELAARLRGDYLKPFAFAGAQA